MQKHLANFSTLKTPQSQPIPGSTQQQNNAGGYAWKVDKWELFGRFLILGTEGGTYYVSEHKLTKDACDATLACIKEDGMRAVNLITEISHAGRAASNDYAIFALAMAMGEGDLETRRLAAEVLPKVCRIGTHLFHFAEYVQQFRRWGRGLRKAVARWYNDMPVERLAYQVVKYQQRDGWSHSDLLRLSHAFPVDKAHSRLYGYVKDGFWADREDLEKNLTLTFDETPKVIWAFERAKTATSIDETVALIKEYGITREMIPTQFLKSPRVWEALLERMPMTAMIRNLGNMSKVGLLTQGNFDTVADVCAKLTDEEHIKKARVHPIAVLAALTTYAQGGGYRGSGSWPVVGDVVDALDQAFYVSFQNVEPSGKRICIGLDVSGSMSSGSINGLPMLTPRVGACAMSMVTYRTEPKVALMAFSHQFIELDISRAQRLNDIVEATSRLPFGGTDCALPVLWAMNQHRNNPNVVFDAFAVYTDSETWYGDIHPKQALDKYRREVNPNAKMVVVGMAANDISIADPDDIGMLDVVGFDTATPGVIAEFLRS